ncbi:hypothetical protein [Cytobacillus kochii]|uniref:hypothetical protein n=1 Tax=Cytobacillus kochii TaxID=859143 RepID=UPI0025A29BBC|nr:hypothetical protein [Cytobacillus kochii]MDM5205348.1 hypothetical protein [Cytobacillus kochii]
MLKNFLILTNKDKKIIIRANTDVEAKNIYREYFDENLKRIRKLRLTDLCETDEHILVLPNKEFI